MNAIGRIPPGTYATLFYRQIPLGYSMVRAYDYFGWVHIDSAGFRGPEVSLVRAPGVVRIMVVGASTTFDIRVTADSLAWPARLQGDLAEGTGGRPIEVINAGVGGYVVQENLIRLETQLYRFHPDVIILYQAHNDLFSFLRRTYQSTPSEFTQRPGEVPSVTPWERWFEEHSLLYAKLRDRLGAIAFHKLRASTLGATLEANRQARDSVLASGAQAFGRELRFFLVVAKSLGIRVVLPAVVQVSGVASDVTDRTQRAEWQRAVPFASPSTVLEGYRQYNEEIKTAAEDQGATYLPTAECGLTGTRWYADGDPIHFNDAGAARMAQCIAAGIRDRGILTK